MMICRGADKVRYGAASHGVLSLRPLRSLRLKHQGRYAVSGRALKQARLVACIVRGSVEDGQRRDEEPRLACRLPGALFVHDGLDHADFEAACGRSVPTTVSPDERSEESPKAMSIRGAASSRRPVGRGLPSASHWTLNCWTLAAETLPTH